MLRLGAIGYGYWGPNVVRNFAAERDCRVTMICDGDPDARARALHHYPAARVLADARDVVASPEIDAVAIVTPVSTHYELARRALEHGKHIFVEKPFTEPTLLARVREVLDTPQPQHRDTHQAR